MSPGPRLIVFDCDGVLVDSEQLAGRAYVDILADIGVDVPDDVWADCLGLKQADIFALIERVSGRTIGEGVRARLWPRTRELFAAELKPTLGVTDFLGRLTTGRCVASSSHPERIRFSLERTGLAGFFGDAVFSTQMVARGKPAPDIYLFAAERMGAAPADVVVIEDSAPGVMGAKAAGASAIGFLGGTHVGPDHETRLREAGADRIAHDWSAVERALSEHANGVL